MEEVRNDGIVDAKNMIIKEYESWSRSGCKCHECGKKKPVVAWMFSGSLKPTPLGLYGVVNIWLCNECVLTVSKSLLFEAIICLLPNVPERKIHDAYADLHEGNSSGFSKYMLLALQKYEGLP